ncbi:hypothetical protein STEG23_009585, partial [Scotinomys teguina]
MKSILTSDMEMQRLEFVLLAFGLALVQYFLIAPFPSFWNGNSISLCNLIPYG